MSGSTQCGQCERVARHICQRCSSQMCNEHAVGPDACQACEAEFADVVAGQVRTTRMIALLLAVTAGITIGFESIVGGVALAAAGLVLAPFARPSKRDVLKLRSRFFRRAELPAARALPPS